MKNHSNIFRYSMDFSELVNDILDRIPADRLLNGKVLDPAIGGGQFVAEIERRKRAAGQTDQEIASSVFGMETTLLYTNNAVHKNGLVGTYCIGNLDAIKESGMKFDVIIGNPPFQETHATGNRKDQASNLWSKFWSKSFDICNDDGIIAYITPTSWLSPSADLKGQDARFSKDRLWEIFDQYTSYADVTNVAKHFPGVGSSFGYVIVDRSGQAGLTFSDGADTSLGFLPISGMDMVMKEMSITNNIGERFKVDQRNQNKLRVSIPMTKALKPEHIEILRGTEIPTTGHKDPAMYIYVYVEDDAQADMVRTRLIDCLDILKTHCRWSGFLNIKTVKLIRISENA